MLKDACRWLAPQLAGRPKHVWCAGGVVTRKNTIDFSLFSVILLPPLFPAAMYSSPTVRAADTLTNTLLHRPVHTDIVPHASLPYASSKAAVNSPVKKWAISAIWPLHIYRQPYGESQRNGIGYISLEPPLGYRQWGYNLKPSAEAGGSWGKDSVSWKEYVGGCSGSGGSGWWRKWHLASWWEFESRIQLCDRFSL